MANQIITRVQVEGNDVVSFLNGTNYVRSMSQILQQSPTYISYKYDTITISQVGGDSFTFTIYTVTEVGGNTFTPLTFQDPSEIVQERTIEVYRLLVTSIFKGCCECGNTEPECSIQYTAGTDPTIAGTLWDVGGVGMRINYFTANSQDFTGFWPIIQDGSWIFVFSKTDPTVYGVYQLSNYTDGGTFAQFDSTLLAGPAGFPDGTSLCVDVTSVGGSLVQDWQDTLNISSVLTQDNLVNAGGFNFEWEDVNRYIINSTGYQSYTATDGTSVGQVYIQPGAVTISGTSYIDIITPNYATATEGMVLALDASGHVEYTLAGTGTISSIELLMPPAFTVSDPNPLTTNGTFTVTVDGDATQYINGLGELATLPVYTVENGLHAFGGVPGEAPPDPFLFHLGGRLREDTLIETTDGTTEFQLAVRGSVEQNTQFPLGVANLGIGGVATFQDFGSGDRPNPSVEIVGDVDLLQPLLELNMEGDLPTADDTLLRLRYSGDPSLAMMTIDYQFRNNNVVVASSNFIGSRLSTEVVSFVDGNEETRFEVQLVDNGTLSNKLELQGFGQLVLNEYATSAFSNSTSNINNDLEYVLAVDTSGNVFKKLSEGGGTVTEVTATGLLTTSPDPITTTGTVTSEMDSGFLVGRYSSGTGVFEQITIGDGLTLSPTGELTVDGGPGITYTVDNGLSPDPLNADNFQLGGTLLKNTEIYTAEYSLGVIRLAGVTGATAQPFGVLNGDGFTGAMSVINSPSTGAAEVAQFVDIETVPNFFAREIVSIFKVSTLDTNQTGIKMEKSPNGLGSSLSIDYHFNRNTNPSSTIAGLAARHNAVITDATLSTFSTAFEISTSYGSFEVIPGTGLYSPIVQRRMQITGPGQMILDSYTTSTAFEDVSGASIGVLNVDSTGKVFVGEGGGGGGTYASAQGIWTEPGSPETFMLGAPSAALAVSDIPFSGADRYIYTADRFLKINGANDFGRILQVENTGYSAASFRSKNYVADFISTEPTLTECYAIYSETIGPAATTIIASNNYSTEVNTIETAIRVNRYFNDAGSSNGVGSRIYFTVPDADGGGGALGSLEFWAPDASSLNFTSNFDVYTQGAGGGLSKNLTVKGSGQLNLNKYTTSTAFDDDSGASIGVLNVDDQGNVFVGEGGGGSSPLTTKGDLYTFDTADTRLPVGLDTQVLLADSSTPTGLRWGTNTTPPASGYYGAFQDDTTQTAVSANTAYPVKFNTTELSNGVTVVNDGSGNPTRVTLANTGIYNVQFSLQLEKTGGAGNFTIDVWLRKNGVDIPDTTGKVVLTGSVNASPIVAAWNYLLDLAGGDYVELMWSTTNNNAVILAAVATPPHPGVPSSILTVTQQAGILAGTGITAINSLTGAVQTMGVGTGGTDFAIDSTGTAHTFNLPTASATNRGALSSADWTRFDSFKTQSIGVTVDGSGGTITAGQKGYVRIPYACTIDRWSILTGNAGLGATVTFDIWRANNAIPTVANSLVGGGTKPFLTSATQQITSAAPTGWTSVTLAANDILGFNVEPGAAIFSWANLQLLVTKT